jgi:hypothetical protein
MSKIDYTHDIFLSYRRTLTVGRWVRNHFLPLLSLRLNEEAPVDVRVFCDTDLTDGDIWPDKLRMELRRSALLVTVATADYFRSRWCMAEWGSFRKREELLGLATAEQPHGLIHIVRYADGNNYDHDAQRRQSRWDFRSLNHPEPAFVNRQEYMDFDLLVTALAKDLVQQIQSIPQFQPDFPIVEPAPLPPVQLTRPVL